MIKHIVTLLASATLIAAADVTGTWSGLAESRFPSGKVETHNLVFMFKQSGGALTGSVGPTRDHQLPIDKGRISGDSVLFDCKWGNGVLLHFAMVVVGDEIRGQADGDAAQAPAGSDENHTNTIYLTLKRWQ